MLQSAPRIGFQECGDFASNFHELNFRRHNVKLTSHTVVYHMFAL